ncbi:hypothetical protein LOAG_04323 [Loa loa]|uniref:Uncharacterized protein n=1 Tax=Loa loa TaxID=7209 RepID=A0A1S0U2M5_LOALO|nr:hypothetical protein LOAG_04323 [Loa loa]EFO24160.1 hypothetical protein LOAG_04323 [Loa loa]
MKEKKERREKSCWLLKHDSTDVKDNEEKPSKKRLRKELIRYEIFLRLRFVAVMILASKLSNMHKANNLQKIRKTERKKLAKVGLKNADSVAGWFVNNFIMRNRKRKSHLDITNRTCTFLASQLEIVNKYTHINYYIKKDSQVLRSISKHTTAEKN